jgi:hypothetical protein
MTVARVSAAASPRRQSSSRRRAAFGRKLSESDRHPAGPTSAGECWRRQQLLDGDGPALRLPTRGGVAAGGRLRGRGHAGCIEVAPGSASSSRANASERFSTPSFAKHAERWLFTVPEETLRRAAISRVVAPFAAKARTSRSRDDTGDGLEDEHDAGLRKPTARLVNPRQGFVAISSRYDGHERRGELRFGGYRRRVRDDSQPIEVESGEHPSLHVRGRCDHDDRVSRASVPDSRPPTRYGVRVVAL